MADSDIRKLLECSICLEEMKDPRILPCHHSFCLGCLRGLRDSGINPPRCPNCNTQIFLYNVEQLPRDFRVNSLRDSLSNWSNPTTRPVQNTGEQVANLSHRRRSPERPWRACDVAAVIIISIAVIGGVYQWTRAIQCPELAPPEHGHLYISSRHVNGTAKVMCDKGYEYNGTIRRVCQADGQWTGLQGTCEEIRCPNLRCDMGECHVDIGDRYVGSTARVFCDEGYIWTGSDIWVCQPDGKWKGRGGTCKDVMCAAVPDDDRIDCGFPGVTKEGCVKVKSCCFDDSNPDVANCYFGDVCAVPNGKRRECGYSGITEDDCLTGDVCCYDDTTPGIPNCYFDEPAECPSSDTDTGIPCAADDDPNITVEKCYVLGCCYDPTINRCYSLPPIQCPELAPPKHGLVYISSQDIMDTAEVVCDEGYKYTGTVRRVCQLDGEWSGSQGTCDAKQCRRLNSPKHGHVDIISRYIQGTARISCDEGYKWTGSDMLVCGMEGQWIGAKGRCKAVHGESEKGLPDRKYQVPEDY